MKGSKNNRQVSRQNMMMVLRTNARHEHGQTQVDSLLERTGRQLGCFLHAPRPAAFSMRVVSETTQWLPPIYWIHRNSSRGKGMDVIVPSSWRGDHTNGLAPWRINHCLTGAWTLAPVPAADEARYWTPSEGWPSLATLSKMGTTQQVQTARLCDWLSADAELALLCCVAARGGHPEFLISIAARSPGRGGLVGEVSGVCSDGSVGLSRHLDSRLP
ncbi:hypothetical protein EDB81DRAFT_61694 [Dactylonectria macrodidyma]|uniref:Uncharacterized protein n=1 Tax=Dactylonectria macrodidyma TaxID=307937 RepID=A0A9P9EPB8_9HYPO|nr:hypothetical protein EDB81DRAFT_61694 [Dactylonectria macrodidyma]